MDNEIELAEEQVRRDLACLLLSAVEASGKTRSAIAGQAHVHRDALRRILFAERSASLGQALRILEACDVPSSAHLILLLTAGSNRAVDWLDSDLAEFFDEFCKEFPVALERILGNQISDVKPRWAKGTANRVARLLSDHIMELERKDNLLGSFFSGERQETDA